MTEPKKYDVTAIGAVGVGIPLQAEDSLLEAHGLKKGFSNEVGASGVEKIIGGTPVTFHPGSPGSNLVAGIAGHGGKAALIGKVGNDKYGAFLAERVQAHGVDFMPVVAENTSTTVIVALTTPDKERSFAANNAASIAITPEDIDENIIRQSRMIYIDSYIWYSESGRETAKHAAALAQKHGVQVAMALNDANLVKTYQKEFLETAQKYADILVGDQREFMALFDTEYPGLALLAANDNRFTFAMTMGKNGADVVEDNQLTHIGVQKVAVVVDTNGAGDQFAAGFLYGLSQGKTAAESGVIGSIWAAEIIQHMGAEPRIGKNAAPTAPAPTAPKP